MNERGGRSGLALALLLIVALIVAWLVMKNGALPGMGNTASIEQGEQGSVQEARNAVDALNDRMLQAVTEP